MKGKIKNKTATLCPWTANVSADDICININTSTAIIARSSGFTGDGSDELTGDPGRREKTGK